MDCTDAGTDTTNSYGSTETKQTQGPSSCLLPRLQTNDQYSPLNNIVDLAPLKTMRPWHASIQEHLSSNNLSNLALHIFLVDEFWLSMMRPFSMFFCLSTAQQKARSRQSASLQRLQLCPPSPAWLCSKPGAVVTGAGWPCSVQ